VTKIGRLMSTHILQIEVRITPPTYCDYDVRTLKGITFGGMFCEQCFTNP
jgi:hypothetical protein